MKLKVLCKDGWVEITPKLKNGEIPMDDVVSHLQLAGYDLSELNCRQTTDGIAWYCNCCGKMIGCLIF